MTPDEVRKHHGIRWRQLWWRLGYDLLKKNKALPVQSVVMDAAKRTGPASHWLVEVALCEAMKGACGALQTDIEDFVPTTQRRHDQQPASG